MINFLEKFHYSTPNDYIIIIIPESVYHCRSSSSDIHKKVTYNEKPLNMHLINKNFSFFGRRIKSPPGAYFLLPNQFYLLFVENKLSLLFLNINKRKSIQINFLI